jgi:hypothetical protein
MLALILLCATAGTAVGQWLSLPLPGTPRTADGKPNLNASAPRTADGKPDLTGLWHAENMRYNANLVPEGTQPPSATYKFGNVQERVTRCESPVCGP